MFLSTRKHQRGINLVELMIGLVVGLIVLAAMSAVYLNTSRGSRDTINANRLNQDLRAIMDIMVADIRRAGYWGTADTGTNPFTGATTNIVVASNCILYSYDATYNGGTAGTADAGTDFFGFRLNGNTIQMIDPAGNLASTAGACSDAQWQSLTDPNTINVSALSFTTGRPTSTDPGSQCMNVDTNTTWTVGYNASSPETLQACSCTSATTCPGYIAPGASDDLIETRQITISLTANHVSDTSLSRTLTETVTVRNNRVIINP